MSRPTIAHIDLDALRHNYALAQSCTPGSCNLAVVKANAYGHGALAVARALEPLAPALGVACLEEARELRQGGIEVPILLLEGPFEADEVNEAAALNCWLMLENATQLQWVIAATLSSPIAVWLKIDSGMHRLGLPLPQTGSAYQQLIASDNVESVVVATHFASADELENPSTEEQIARFDHACEGIPAGRSMANSSGLLGWPAARADWNRPGIMLYGASPFAEAHPEADKLRPVMTLDSQVISLRHIAAGEAVGYGGAWIAQRESIIATVAIGYGDGYPRHAPAGTPVLIKGQVAPLAGRVSMDMITVDVTDLENVMQGSSARLWGEGLPVNEVAAWADTIGYELLTRMPARVPRVYSGEG